MSLEQFREQLGRQLKPGVKKVLDEGNAHPRTCKCATCLKWWQLMTRPDDEDQDFGPFTKEEVHGPDPSKDGQPLS